MPREFTAEELERQHREFKALEAHNMRTEAEGRLKAKMKARELPSQPAHMTDPDLRDLIANRLSWDELMDHRKLMGLEEQERRRKAIAESERIRHEQTERGGRMYEARQKMIRDAQAEVDERTRRIEDREKKRTQFRDTLPPR